MKNAAICVLVFCFGFCPQANGQAGIITTVAGGNGAAFTFPTNVTVALNAPFGNISGVASDSQGNIYVADSINNRIFLISPNGGIQIAVGNGTPGYGGDGGPAISAALSGTSAMTVDASGNLFIVDNGRIRKVSASGIITTIAGSGGGQGYSGDGGPATSANLFRPSGVAVDAAGNLFIADSGNNRVRKVSASGIITTVAGNGTAGFSGDGGTATSAELNSPGSVAVDGSGDLFIADHENNRLRKVSASGIITTVAGNGTFLGFSGDGGPATSAGFYFLGSVASDASGNLFIADNGNNRVRKVSAGSGIVTTVAGNGVEGFLGDGGQATSAELNSPGVAAIDAAGNLFIADGYN